MNGVPFSLVRPTTLLRGLESGDFDELFAEAETLKKPHPKDEVIRELTAELDSAKVDVENLGQDHAEQLRLQKILSIKALSVILRMLDWPLVNLLVRGLVKRESAKTISGDEGELLVKLRSLMEQTNMRVELKRD